MMTIQEMIDNLKIMQAEIEWEYPLDYAATIDNVIEVLEKSEQGWKTGHWIPYENCKPKINGTYLVSGIWESGKVSVGECEYSIIDGYFDTAWNFDVKAWMPLPEPYDGEVMNDE